MDIPSSASPRQTRRRGQVLEDQLLQAAWDELAEGGYQRFTMERVAARAGSGKGALYRRWPNRAALLRAAFYRMPQAAPDARSSRGALRDDLVEILEESGHFFDSPFGEAMRALVSEAGGNPLAATLDQEPVPQVMEALAWAAARQDPTVDGVMAWCVPVEVPSPVVNLGLQMASLHFLSNGEKADRDKNVEIVDLLWLPLLTLHSGFRNDPGGT